MVADVLCSVVDPESVTAGGLHKELPAAAPAHRICPEMFKLPQRLSVAVTAAPAPGQVVAPLLSQQHRTVPFNDLEGGIIEFSTPLFEGQALLLLRNLPNTPQAVFEGLKRQMVFTVQGRFKREGVALGSLMLGSDFQRPLRLPTGPLITQAAVWLVRKMGGGVQLQPHGDAPHVFAPLIAAAQIVNVALPGRQPDLRCPHEDMTLYDAGLVNRWTGKPMAATKRRSYFSAATHRAGRCYDTQHVWTFQMYDHVCAYASFSLNVPLFKFDLVQVLDGQPLQLLLRDMGSGLSMLHLTVHHERMLEHPANQLEAAADSPDECPAASTAATAAQ